jgi:5'-deoxynucleotidase YfbR-like HD superfamily hydrolase
VVVQGTAAALGIQRPESVAEHSFRTATVGITLAGVGA